MEIINNKVDNLFREIRSVRFYDAENYPFSHQFKGKDISAEALLEIKNIIPEDFDRNIKPKQSNGNRYFELDCTFSIYNIEPKERATLERLLNRKQFSIQLFSNEERTIFGNSAEPLEVNVIDGIKENNTGTDAFFINIKGDSISPAVVFKM